jgi:hypothetical protein
MRGHTDVGEQGVQEGTKHAPLRGPCVERQCVDLSGIPGSSCRGSSLVSWVLSLVMSLESTMVLNAEL